MLDYLSPASDSRRWHGFAFRDGDVVITTPPKCGTTWTQMLVALLVFDGPELPAPLTVLSPWLDSDMTPMVDLNHRLEQQEHRRFIKTHVPLDGLPGDDRAHFVVVGRDPRDVYLSMVDHGRVSDDEHWDVRLVETIGGEELARREALSAQPGSFAEAIEMPRGTCHTGAHPAQVLHHLHDAWQRRSEPNVTLLHYADLSSDTTGSMEILAHDLDFEVSPSRCAELAGHASLAAMRERAGDLAPEVDHAAWKDPAQFFAAGRVGAWRSAFSEHELSRYEARAVELYPDQEFLSWAHNGAAGGRWRHVGA